MFCCDGQHCAQGRSGSPILGLRLRRSCPLVHQRTADWTATECSSERAAGFASDTRPAAGGAER